MRAERIILRNFCQHQFREIVFGPGMTAIVGPIGSGKSNILGAMKYALTGKHPNKGTKEDNICQWIGPTETSGVDFTFSHAGTRATVKRHLLPTTAQTTLSIDGVTQPIRGDTKVNEKIMEILGIDAEILNDVAIVDQGDIFGFMDKTPAKRSAAFAKLFRTDVAEEVWQALGKHVGGLSIPTVAVDVDSVERALGEERTQLEQAQTALAGRSTQNILARLTKAREIKEVARRRDTLLTTISQCQARIAELETGNEKLRKALEDTQTNIKTLEDAAAGSKDAAKEASASLVLLDRYTRDQQVLEGYREDIARYDKELAALTEPTEPEGYSNLNLSQDLQLAYDAWREKQLFVDSFDPKKNLVECPMCHTPTRNLASGLEAARLALPDLKSKHEAIKAQKNANEAHDRELYQWQREVMRLNDLKKVVEDQMAKLLTDPPPAESEDELRATVKQHDDYVAAIPHYTKLEGEQSGMLSKMEGELTWQRDALENAQTDLAAIPADTLPSAAEDDELALTNEFNTVQRLEHETMQISASILRQEAFLETTREAQQEARSLRGWTNKVVAMRDLLHRDAAPRFVAQRNLMRTEAGVNENLGRFDSNFRVSADQGLTFRANFTDGRDQPADRLSFGQKVVLALSFRLAVNFMYGDLGFLALDEPTAYMDTATLENFSEVLTPLRAYTASRGFQCLIITHETALAHMFDAVESL